MSEKCKEMVTPPHAWRQSRCSRNAVKDGYCTQHHPDTVAARRTKQNAIYQAQNEAEREKWKAESVGQLVANRFQFPVDAVTITRKEWEEL